MDYFKHSSFFSLKLFSRSFINYIFLFPLFILLLIAPFNRVLIFNRGLFFIGTIIYIPFILITILFRPKFLIFDKKKYGIFLILIIYFLSMLSASYSFDIEITINYLKHIIFAIFLFLLNSNAQTVKVYNLSFFLIGIITIFLFYFLGDNYFGGDRLSINLNDGQTILDPNIISFNLVVFNLLLLRNIFSNKYYFYSIIFMLLFLISTYYIFLTGSRSSLLSLFIGTFIFVFYKLTRNGRFLFALLNIFFVIIFFFIVNTSNNPLLQRFSLDTIFFTDGGGRFLAWINSLEYFLNSNLLKLIFGNGVGTSLYSDLGFSSHNFIIEYLLDFGLVGLLVFCSIFYRIYKKIKGMKNSYYVALFFALLVWGTFISIDKDLFYIVILSFLIKI